MQHISGLAPVATHTTNFTVNDTNNETNVETEFCGMIIATHVQNASLLQGLACITNVISVDI